MKQIITFIFLLSFTIPSIAQLTSEKQIKLIEKVLKENRTNKDRAYAFRDLSKKYSDWGDVYYLYSRFYRKYYEYGSKIEDEALYKSMELGYTHFNKIHEITGDNPFNEFCMSYYFHLKDNRVEYTVNHEKIISQSKHGYSSGVNKSYGNYILTYSLLSSIEDSKELKKEEIERRLKEAEKLISSSFPYQEDRAFLHGLIKKKKFQTKNETTVGEQNNPFFGKWKIENYSAFRIEKSSGADIKLITKEGAETIFRKISNTKYEQPIPRSDTKSLTLELIDDLTIEMKAVYNDGQISSQIMKKLGRLESKKEDVVIDNTYTEWEPITNENWNNNIFTKNIGNNMMYFVLNINGEYRRKELLKSNIEGLTYTFKGVYEQYRRDVGRHVMIDNSYVKIENNLLFVKEKADNGLVKWVDKYRPINQKIGCIEGNCISGIGQKIFTDKSAYSGEFQNGKMHGKGTLTMINGTIYKGDFLNDMKEGNGTITFENDDVYEGEMSNNEINGYGTYTWAKKNLYGAQKYVGNFKSGKFHGQGKKYDWLGVPFDKGLYKYGKLQSEGSSVVSSNKNYSIVKRGEWKSLGLTDLSGRKKRLIWFRIEGEKTDAIVEIIRLDNGKYTSGTGYSTDRDGLINKHEYSSEENCINSTIQKRME